MVEIDARGSGPEDWCRCSSQTNSRGYRPFCAGHNHGYGLSTPHRPAGERRSHPVSGGCTTTVVVPVATPPSPSTTTHAHHVGNRSPQSRRNVRCLVPPPRSCRCCPSRTNRAACRSVPGMSRSPSLSPAGRAALDRRSSRSHSSVCGCTTTVVVPAATPPSPSTTRTPTTWGASRCKARRRNVQCLVL